MWVEVRLLTDVPAQIGGCWYPEAQRGAVISYPDLMAARLIAKGSAELLDAPYGLRARLAKLAAEVDAEIEEEVAHG